MPGFGRIYSRIGGLEMSNKMSGLMFVAISIMAALATKNLMFFMGVPAGIYLMNVKEESEED